MKMRLPVLLLLGLLVGQVQAEPIKNKDGQLYDEIDLMSNPFSAYDRSRAILRTLVDFEWHVSDIQKDHIVADSNGKEKLRVDFSGDKIVMTEVPTNFIFEREWFGKLHQRIVRELLYIRHEKMAEQVTMEAAQ